MDNSALRKKVISNDPATLETLKGPELTHPMTGIFTDVSDDILEALLPSCRIMEVDKGHEFYHESEMLDTIYFVIDGSYRLGHKVGTNERANIRSIPVAQQTEMIVFGEAEFLLKTDLPGKFDVDVSGNAHASVSVIERGRVLCVSPSEALFSKNDFQLAYNLCRILCVKVIRRSQTLEVKWRHSGIYLVVRGLHGLVSSVINTEHAKDSEFRCAIHFVEFAQRFGVDQTGITRFKNKLKDGDNFYRNFSWERGDLKISGRFLEKLISDPEEVAQALSKRVGGKNMHPSLWSLLNDP